MSGYDVRFAAYEQAMHRNNNFGLSGEEVGAQYGRYSEGLQRDEIKAANRANGREFARMLAEERAARRADYISFWENADLTSYANAPAEPELVEPRALPPASEPAPRTPHAPHPPRHVNEDLREAHRQYQNVLQRKDQAKEVLETKRAAMEAAKEAKIAAKNAVAQAKAAMSSATSTNGAAFALKRLIVTQRQANAAYKAAIAEYNAAARSFNGLISECINVYRGYTAIKSASAPKGMLEKIKTSCKTKVNGWKNESKLAKEISKMPGWLKIAGAVALTGAAVLGAIALFGSDEEENTESVVTETEAEAEAVPAAPAEEEPAGTETPAPAANAALQAADTPATVEAPAEEEQAEIIDEAAVDEEIAQEETQVVYTVEANDCLWNICKRELRDKNGVEPTGAQIIARIGEVMEANGLHWEADGQHVMIYPGQSLNM